MGHRTQTLAPVGSCVSAADRGVCLAQAFLNITSAKFPPKGILLAQGNETRELLKERAHQQWKRKRVSFSSPCPGSEGSHTRKLSIYAWLIQLSTEGRSVKAPLAKNDTFMRKEWSRVSFSPVISAEPADLFF